MFGSGCVLRSMAVRRAVAAASNAASLTRSQVNPPTSDLHTLLALTLLWKLDQFDRLDVLATLRHAA